MSFHIVSWHCSQCGEFLQAPAGSAGARWICRACGSDGYVPTREQLEGDDSVEVVLPVEQKMSTWFVVVLVVVMVGAFYMAPKLWSLFKEVVK